MLGEDVFADANKIEADLRFLEGMRQAQKEFEGRICMASCSQEPEVIAVLRLSPIYQFAEFFYLLRARHIETVEQMKALAELHNAYIADLTKDTAKMRRLGLNQDRLLDAIFTSDTMPRLLQQWRDRPGSIDQSNLARFLVSIMSTETCRKLVVASASAGFLSRERTPFGTIIVQSAGIMEQVFGACVREIRESTAYPGGV